MEQDPFKRIALYTTSLPDGGVHVSTEYMMVDLITISKAGGHTLAMLQEAIAQTWPEVEVGVQVPAEKKN